MNRIMQDRFKFRIPMFTDKDTFTEFQYIELGDEVECTLCGYNGEPQQCTGLKDKNGKLIYENDIVRFKDNITINGSKTHISVVEHNEAFNAFMYHAECMGLYTVNKAQNEKFEVEVIGNIYENKELLNEDT